MRSEREGLRAAHLLLMSFAVACATCSEPKAEKKHEPPATSKPAVICDSLDSCLGKIDTADRHSSEEVANIVLSHGKAAIPGLIALLGDDRAETVYRAVHLLARVDGLSPLELPALIAASDSKQICVISSVARIDTPEAMLFIAREFAKPGYNDCHENDFEPVFRNLGEKLTPYAFEEIERLDPRIDELVEHSRARSAALEKVFATLGSRRSLDDVRRAQYELEKLESTEPTEEELLRIASIFRFIGHSPDVVSKLLAIASDRKKHPIVRRRAILALGEIGPTAMTAVSDLQSLAQREPKALEGTVEQALFTMGHTDTILARLERARIDGLLVHDLPYDRVSSDLVGAALLPFVDSPDWDTVAAAIQALGKLRYKQAVPALIHAVKREDDWEIVLAAIVALQRMKAVDASSDLERVSKQHWFPVVRCSARRALEVFAGSASSVEESELDDFRSLLCHRPEEGCPELCCAKCNTVPFAGPRVKDGPPYVIYRKVPIREAKKEGLDWKRMAGVLVDGDYVIDTREYEEPVHLAVDGGWLIGTDQGEWGGELFFQGKNNERYTVFDGNICGIHRLSSGIVAIAGGRYGFPQEEKIIKVSQEEKGKYTAVPWRAIPGISNWEHIESDGRLYISTTEGGDMLLSPDGKLEMAPCCKTEKKE